MGKTLGQVITQVRELIGDYQETTYSAAAVIEAINFAQDLVIRTKGFKVGKRIYNIGAIPTGHFPSDYLAVKRIQIIEIASSYVKNWYNPLNTDITDANDVVLKYLHESTMAHEDSVNETWQTSSNRTLPKRWVMSGNMEFTVVPPRMPSSYTAPEGYVAKVRLHYIQKATEMLYTEDPVDSSIPDYYQDAIRYAAVAYLMEKDTDLKSQQLKVEMMKSFSYHMEGGVPPIATTEVDS